MVLKTATVLSCLLPARFGHPRPDPPLADAVPFDGPDLVRTAHTHLGDIGESPTRHHRAKRSSLTAFFAFSSKRKVQNVAPPQSVPGRWQTTADACSYYTATSPHPYAYATPLKSPSLRHVASQPFRLGSGPSSHLGHHVSQSQPHLSQLPSMSTPNLAVGESPSRAASRIRKRPPKPKRQERWLSAETWWDALLSPSPRFTVKQAPRPHTANGRVMHEPAQGEQHGRILGVRFPSLPTARPRAASVTSHGRPVRASIARSRSATDLASSAAFHASFEPALETLVDELAPMPDHASSRHTELSLEPPLSLEQVIDEGRVFEEQRAQWKRQASQSIGNKHTRSFSRARSKSLGEKHAQGHSTSEGSKPPFNLDFLAARSLLGSQSTMPTVHVTKPSGSSSHSKAYSHSHSHSAYSFTHTCHSRANSHSHSHSLTTSHSSKSSRNPRTHSRSGSWSRSALLKAGSLCGVTQEDSSGEENVPSSSRVDVQGTIHITAATSAEGAPQSPKVSPPPNVPMDDVGIAISSTPPLESPLGVIVGNHSSRRQAHQDKRLSPSKHTHRSSEYAGPHRSAVDSKMPPQFDVTSNVSLRHRLPPRPAIYPPITPIVHPYRSALAVCDKANQGATSTVQNGHAPSEPCPESTPHPHISLSHSDFERYGVGEALVYASLPRSPGAPEVEQTDLNSPQLPPPEEPSASRETLVSQNEESDTASIVMKSPPSLTNSTIQMVMSAFNNPDDLDEFQDLFYKPHPVSYQELGVPINQVPTDVRSSASSSPLTHLVRKLSEEVSGRRDPSQTPSDPRSEPQDPPSGESTTKFVFMDFVRSSPLPTESSSSQLQLPIQGGKESTMQPVMVIPEDVDSFYSESVLEGLSPDRENDTFGYPIKHGRFDAATPSPVQPPIRVSTHASIQDEDETEELPVMKRFGLSVDDEVVRSSYLTTTSDVSQMSGLLDFPLPPGVRPGDLSGQTLISHAYLEPMPSEPESPSDRQDGVGDEDEDGDGDEDEDATELAHGRLEDANENRGCPSGDVETTLHALRMARPASFTSHRTTFGGSDDMEFITRMHGEGP